MRVKTAVATAGIVGTLLVIAGGMAAWKYKAIQAGKSRVMPEFPTAVEVVQAAEGTFQRSISAVGTVQAVRWVTVATEVSGKVSEVGFESGHVVEEGAVLLRLDSSTERADLRAATAAATLAEATVERYRQAMAGGAGGKVVSQQDIDRAAAEVEQAHARVEQLKAVIAKKEVRAPFKGRVGMRDVQPGEYLSEGERITTLQGLSDEVYVDFRVPQMVAAGVRPGSKVSVTIGGAGGAGSVEREAVVSALDAQINAESRNAWVRATMPSMDGRLVPGMFVDVRVPVGQPAPVVTVPPTAVRHAPFGDHLFVIEPDEEDANQLRAHQRFVKVGGAATTGVIIASGLKAGEKLAADGSFKLREGALVMPVPPPQPPGSDGTPGGSAAPSTPAEPAANS